MLDRLLRFGPGLALVAALAAVCVRDPHRPGSWAACPTWALFGVACPGCGSLRALHDIGQGRWLESIGHNRLVLPGIAVATAVLLLRSPLPGSPSPGSARGVAPPSARPPLRARGRAVPGG